MGWNTRRDQRLLRRLQRVYNKSRRLPGREAVDMLVDEVGHLQSDSEIATFAVEVLEAFIDSRAVELRDEMARGLRRSPMLRQAYRGSIAHIPLAIDEELRTIASLT